MPCYSWVYIIFVLFDGSELVCIAENLTWFHSNIPIKQKREYLGGLTNLPDWRITCFFVDKDYRGKGVASIALEGALYEIARLGGGTVESYPEDVEGRSVSGSFLYNSTISIFERQGFQRTRRLGKNHWVMTKVIDSRS